MLRVARHCRGAVLDSTWFDYALPLVRTLPGQLVEVRCLVPLDLARARYRSRSAHRHVGHLDAARSEQELWGKPSRPLGLGPVIDVETSGPVNVSQLADDIARILAST